MTETIAFDREKFKDAVHVAIDCAVREHGVSSIGNTKLHKIMYYADMLRYLEFGVPMTGAVYQRQKFGPTARHLGWALRELESEGRIRVGDSQYFGYKKLDFEPLQQPASNRLSDEEVNLLGHMVDFVCVRSASEISEFSHDEVWASVPIGEAIPYYAAFVMFPAEVVDEDIDDANLEVLQLAAQIKAGLSESKTV